MSAIITSWYYPFLVSKQCRIGDLHVILAKGWSEKDNLFIAGSALLILRPLYIYREVKVVDAVVAGSAPPTHTHLKLWLIIRKSWLRTNCHCKFGRHFLLARSHWDSCKLEDDWPNGGHTVRCLVPWLMTERLVPLLHYHANKNYIMRREKIY